MGTVFGSTSTTEDVLDGIDLQDKRILVSGVSAGLGVETARSLAAHGAQVVGTLRDLKKGEAATALVRRESATKGASSEIVELDLAVLTACDTAVITSWKGANRSTWLSPMRV